MIFFPNESHEYIEYASKEFNQVEKLIGQTDGSSVN